LPAMNTEKAKTNEVKQANRSPRFESILDSSPGDRSAGHVIGAAAHLSRSRLVAAQLQRSIGNRALVHRLSVHSTAARHDVACILEAVRRRHDRVRQHIGADARPNSALKQRHGKHLVGLYSGLCPGATPHGRTRDEPPCGHAGIFYRADTIANVSKMATNCRLATLNLAPSAYEV
jgi:hypothetical protein